MVTLDGTRLVSESDDRATVAATITTDLSPVAGLATGLTRSFEAPDIGSR